MLRVRKKPITRILAYHDVAAEQVSNFRTQIEYLKQNTNIVSLNDFFAGRLSWEKLNIVITFDDGYQSWLDNVLPVLSDFGVTATFFASSGFVGLRGEGEADFQRKNLGSDQQTTGSLGAEGLRKLAQAGCAIGGHTINHVNLSVIHDVNEVRNEIHMDKKELETITGTKVEYFAYPFGLYDNPHIDLALILQEAGYRGAVTLVPASITARWSGFYLNRYLVNAAMPISVFKARILGNYDGVQFIRKLLTTNSITWSRSEKLR